MLRFPDGFLWGAATASYQIEGAYDENGKGESIWDRFVRMPGKILGGDTGNGACDHYHRYLEDVALMKQIGLKAYRFSIAWPRILPEGRGRVNTAGLDFYSRLVDELLKAGIEPFVTLYHWDLPQALQDKGGWANRDTAHYFAEYVAHVAKRLDGSVTHWITHNEPWVVAYLGHGTGVHAPGVQNMATAIRVAHHLLLSHGEAVGVLRNYGGENTKVGITLNLSPVHPASESDEDRETAQRLDGHLNRWFLDAILQGAYPEDMVAWYGDYAPPIEPGDMERFRAPIDFLGVNYYTRNVVEDDPKGGFLQMRSKKPAGRDYTDMNWEIYPEGLYEILTRVNSEYGPVPLYVTENGAASSDIVNAEGKVLDEARVNYLREHFIQAHRAIQDGVDLRGYFVWSLMDNFEWAHGYSKRFGIVYVDYPTQKRSIKESGYWYGRVIAENSLPDV